MKNYDDALNALLEHTNLPLGIEFVSLKDAHGRILASDLRANENYPALPTAAMDGVALKSSDIKTGAKLFVKGVAPAGFMPNADIKENECVKTFTGALMCEGSDTLLPLENLEFQSENGVEFALIKECVNAGFAVRNVGESYQKGQILLKAGVRLDFAGICVLAEQGVGQVCVFKKPKVAILATGSELIEPGKKKQNPAQSYNSNAYALCALMSSWGCECEILAPLKDDMKMLENTLKRALKDCDFFVSTGGVSVGEFDFMRDFVRKNGQMIIDKVAIKPGRHIKIAKLDSKIIFALPGFSYSALVTAILFIKPFLARFFGMSDARRHFAILCEDYLQKGDLENFSAASVIEENGILKISTEGKKQGSSAISTNLLNNAVLLRSSKSAKKGDLVEFLNTEF